MAHTPKDFTTEIKDKSEKAFQRAVWLCKTSQLEATTVSWLDIEIPVDDGGREGSQRLDLIGIDDKGVYVLCEMKFGKSSNTDSPQEAAEQVAGYWAELAKHPSTLRTHGQGERRGGVDWAKVAAKTTRKVVVANDEYWRYWLDHRKVSVPNDVECYALPIDMNLFEKQRSDSGETTYTPEIPTEQNKWRRLTPSANKA